MIYTPNFCNNCGEKIERDGLKLTDSTRFCDICKHDFVLRERVLQVFVALMAILGVFAIGSFWRSGEKPLNVVAKQSAAANSNSAKMPANNAPPTVQNQNTARFALTNISTVNSPQASNTISKPPMKKTDSTSDSMNEAVYFCGAETKKGTPCSRRVKGGGRCWQHQGQKAILPPEKLLASQ